MVRTIIVCLCLFAVLSVFAFANETDADQRDRIVKQIAIEWKVGGVVTLPTGEKIVITKIDNQYARGKRNFWILQAVKYGSMVADYEVALRNYRQHPDAKEVNPVVHPLLKAGRPALYGAMVPAHVLTSYLTRKWQRSGQNLWWLSDCMWIGWHSAGAAINW